MLIFCILWLPLFYLLWNIIRPENGACPRDRFFERVFALAAGVFTGIVRFFMPAIRASDAFGVSRLLGACANFAIIPPLVAIASALLFYKIPRTILKSAGFSDMAGGMFIAMIPSSVIHATIYGTGNDPSNLVLVPLMWTAIILNTYFAGIRFGSNNFAKNIFIYTAAFIVSGLLASVTWLAFFASKPAIGLILFIITAAPSVLYTITLFRNRQKRNVSIM